MPAGGDGGGAGIAATPHPFGIADEESEDEGEGEAAAAAEAPAVGAAVWWNVWGRGMWYRRKVAAVHADGTVDLRDKDGNFEAGDKYPWGRGRKGHPRVKPEEVRGDGGAAALRAGAERGAAAQARRTASSAMRPSSTSAAAAPTARRRSRPWHKGTSSAWAVRQPISSSAALSLISSQCRRLPMESC